MISFEEDEAGLILLYEEEYRNGEWVRQRLEQAGRVRLSRVFYFEKADLLDVWEEDLTRRPIGFAFRFALREGSLYRIAGRILGIANDVLLPPAGLKIERKLFAAARDISVFRTIAAVTRPEGDIAIGDGEGAIPIEIFKLLLAKFPKTTELDLYARARVADIVGDFFADMPDHRARYEAYLDRRSTLDPGDFPRMDLQLRTEIAKYIYIRDTIAAWLSEASVRPERDWQAMILEFILLLFPKYVAVLQNVHVPDRYARRGRTTPRYIDVALIDANGHVDVIEIKRPFEDLLLSRNRYRGNHVPGRELSGTIMQAEKYLFHLAKWGVEGEEQLTRRYAGALPPGLELRITNPRAIAILGRSAALDPDQLFDFELIRRKYGKLLDIITYDDLLARLDCLIHSLQLRLASGTAATGAGAAELDAVRRGD